MRVLVTGASGFVGRKLVEVLTARGDEVVALDKVNRGFPDVETMTIDLASLPHVIDAMSKVRPEVVFHAGALLSAVAEADVLSSVMGNANGTFHLLEACRLFGVRQMVFTSTIATYGRAAGDVVSDDAPQFPSSIYGVTKVFGERLGEYYASRYGFDFRAVRLPSVIGPGRSATGLSAYSSLMIDLPAQGEPIVVPVAAETAIPIIYIADAVQALIQLSATDQVELSRRCYLVAGTSPSASDIREEVIRQVPGARIDFSPNEEAQRIVDSWPRSLDDSSAAADWSWKQEYDLPATVGAFVEAYR
ncbi:MAG: NAD-dependent epimerase/dehydratase family protein [Actinomycetota bacterium]|nr:NAD-dependent epimerase/dehydratase family protein [Actinomycetota bacterium]